MEQFDQLYAAARKLFEVLAERELASMPGRHFAKGFASLSALKASLDKDPKPDEGDTALLLEAAGHFHDAWRVLGRKARDSERGQTFKRFGMGVLELVRGSWE